MDFSYFECYVCHKLRCVSIHFPLNKGNFNKKNQKFHAHAIEENESDEEKAREIKTLVKNMY